MSSLMETSMEVASSFIKSVLFVDDQIYEKNTEIPDHGIDIESIISSFAVKKKLCISHRFTGENDIPTIIKLVNLSDVCILDWKLIASKHNTSENSEEDSDVSNRGVYALKIINEVAAQAFDAPKLIIIYTAETNEEVMQELSSLKNGTVGNHSWTSINKNLKIVVYNKEQLGYPHSADRTLNTDGLHNAILKEYADWHCGLLPNFILKSISAIRENTNLLLGKFTKELDRAFVCHRAMCPNPDDSSLLIKKTVINAFEAILSYANVEDVINTQNVCSWIEHINDQPISNTTLKPTLHVTMEVRKSWQSKSYVQFFKEHFGNDENFERFEQYKLKQVALDCFANNIKDEIHQRFSYLTMIKSNFKNADCNHPKLTLGTIVKSESGEYLLCIQQSCDAVRIETTRNFLFLPLQKDTGRDLIVYAENSFIHFGLKKKTYDLILIHFPANNDQRVVAEQNVFSCTKSKKYSWVGDLMESIALKFVNEYTHALSRVGIDQSEWLRRKN